MKLKMTGVKLVSIGVIIRDLVPFRTLLYTDDRWSYLFSVLTQANITQELLIIQEFSSLLRSRLLKGEMNLCHTHKLKGSSTCYFYMGVPPGKKALSIPYRYYHNK